MTEQPKVRRGQIWRDNDPRVPEGYRRLIRVESLDERYAYCVNVETGRATRIALLRFNDARQTGYSLFKEAPQ